MNKIYFLKLFIKAKFYALLCKINIHPLKYYSHTTKILKSNSKYNYEKSIITDVYKCKLCNKHIHNERN